MLDDGPQVEETQHAGQAGGEREVVALIGSAAVVPLNRLAAHLQGQGAGGWRVDAVLFFLWTRCHTVPESPGCELGETLVPVR